MQRMRSSAYNAGPSISHHRQSQGAINSEPENSELHLGVFGKYSEKEFFSDLRVEIDRELALNHSTYPGYLRSRASIMRSSTVSKATTRVKPQMPSGKESLQLVPSSAFQKPRRCQSASAVRKKLFHAVEQGCTNSYQHPNHKLQSQIDALRNLATASFSKTPMKAVKGYRTLTADSSIHQGMTSISRKNSGVSIPVNKTQNQEECIAGVGICPSQSASASILMSNNAQQPANPVYPSQSVLVGGYRSSSVQLEVELVERLNEIRRSNLPEKTLSRTRACQNVLDSIVLQDEHYGRLLSRIRDEFSAYVDITSRKSPTKSNNGKSANPWCARGQDVFEFALLKQENTVMRKRVSTMQREIETLQAALRQARAVELSSRSNESMGDTSSPGVWLEDDQIQEDDLADVQLFTVDDANEQHFRPLVVPKLSFATLPAYSDEEEEEEEGYTQ